MYKYSSINDLRPGMKVGRLTILSTKKHIKGPKRNNVEMDCLCSCGKELRVNVEVLKRGSQYASCGCAKKEMRASLQWSFDQRKKTASSNKKASRMSSGPIPEGPTRNTDDMHEVQRLAREMHQDLGMTLPEAIKHFKEELS